MEQITLKPSQCSAAIKACVQAGVTPILWGAPGAGKTAIVTQCAKEMGYDLTVMHPAVSDPTDYKGMPWVNNGKADFLPFGDLWELIECPKNKIAFMDDMGQSPNAVQAAVMQILWGGRIDGHTISDKVSFVLASNREIDRAFVQRLITPIANRIVHINFTVDLDDWCNWALGNNIQIETVAFVRFRPDLLHDFVPEKAVRGFPSPRSWEFVSRIIAQKPAADIEFALLAGSIGEGAAAEFLGFLKIFRSLPNIDNILLNPKQEKIPEEPAALYAVSAALAKKSSAQNFDRVCTYAERMPKEFSVFTIRDSAKINPEIATTPAFIKWVSANSKWIV